MDSTFSNSPFRKIFISENYNHRYSSSVHCFLFPVLLKKVKGLPRDVEICSGKYIPESAEATINSEIYQIQKNKVD